MVGALVIIGALVAWIVVLEWFGRALDDWRPSDDL
jgi:hypothetical protein